MLTVSESDIAARIARDNPWWEDGTNSIPEAAHLRRIYFHRFVDLALNFDIRRASVLLGPRRVGKTFIAKQAIFEAIERGIPKDSILYASMDTPLYAGLRLEKFIDFIPNKTSEQLLVIFDEIQYLKNWEVHLKDLVDSYPNIKFIATGSAAAALKLKSKESGAGRFSEFLLPPLTFHEFLCFSSKDDELISEDFDNGRKFYKADNIESLNSEFINYLNFGGYPEVLFNPAIRSNADQFVKNDIIDKVLLKDLPSLYGISDIQELNRLFSLIAFNTGGEVSIQNISRESGLAKPTIKKYLEYLESAFLVLRLPTVDENCKSLKRIHNFKMYLTNPSMRAALFAPVSKEDTQQIGHLAEAAILAQWQHSKSFNNIKYARWKGGEVDIVFLSPDQKPSWLVEIKWNDRIKDQFGDASKPARRFLEKNRTVSDVVFTSKTYSFEGEFEKKRLRIIPSALYCYTVGRNIAESLSQVPNYEFSSDNF